MEEDQVLRILGGVGAVIVGSHIVYASGKHGTAYINKDALYPHTKKISFVCRVIAYEFSGYDKIDAVIAPAVGGVILSQWIAYHLTAFTGREVLALYAEKSTNEDAFVIRRGYDRIIAGKNVLVVEDVMTTGASVRKVVEAVRACGGNVIGVGALCNRGGVTAQDVGDVPILYSLVNIVMDAWDEAECPLCKEGKPINTDVGHGREFLERKCVMAE